MSQKAITIFTPSGTDPHITAEDDAFIYSALSGMTDGILGGLTCVRVDDNTVRLSGGGVMNRGHILRIPDGETLELTVASGTAGVVRYDSVVAEFVRGGGDTADNYQIKVLQGTSAPPTLVTSRPLNAGDVNQVELFRLTLNGTVLSDIARKAAAVAAMPNISSGTADPSGGSDGDIYLKIVE